MYDYKIENRKQSTIDFKCHANNLLIRADALVPAWLPDGKRQGDEWVARNPKRADEHLGSFKINLCTGEWADFATEAKGGDLISLYAYLHSCNNGEAVTRLQEDGHRQAGYSDLSNTHKKQTKPDDWKSISPAPIDAPEPNFFNLKYNKEPDLKWAYFDSQMHVVFWVCRFNHADGSKDMLPLTYGILNGKQGWHWKWISDNRPLYNLPGLIADSRPVLVVQGEKTADAARDLFGNDYCVTTSSGGDKRVHQSDWTVLKNKDVIIWPDNDDSGIKAARDVAEILLKSDAKSVRIVKLPTEQFPAGWDVADEFPESLTLDHINKYLDNASLVSNNSLSDTQNEKSDLVKLIEEVAKKHGVKVLSCGKMVDRQGMSIDLARKVRLYNDELHKKLKINSQNLKDCIAEYIDEHRETKKISQKERFRHKDDYVQILIKSKDGDEYYQNICTPVVDIFAHTISITGENCGRWLRWTDSRGKEHKWALPMRLLAGDGCAVQERLLDRDVRIVPGQEKNLKLYFLMSQPTEEKTSISQIGWVPDNSAFALPNTTIGDQKYIFQNDRLNHAFGTAGDLDQWNEKIGKYAVENPILILAMSLAIAAPLLKILNEEGILVHLHCRSSRGKTTILQCANSIWGHGKNYLGTWNGTAGAHEAIASAHNHNLMTLDEIKSANSDTVGDTIYAFGNGVGKSRLKSSIDLRDTFVWRLCGLSSGEITLSEKLKESKKNQKLYAGHQVRFLEIPVDDKYGAFENSHDFENSRKLADHLKRVTSEFYGTPSNKFIEALLLQPQENLEEYCKSFIDLFIEALKIPKDADPQIGRVARKFAIIALGGSLATEYGVFNSWSRTTAVCGVKKCFDEWLHSRGGTSQQSFDEIEILDRTTAFLQKNMNSRFYDLDSSGLNQTIINQAGYKKNKHGKQYFFMPKASFKEEICKGDNITEVARILAKEGYLSPESDTCFTRKESIGDSRSRVYVLTSKAIGLEEEQTHEHSMQNHSSLKNGTSSDRW